jgi:phosphoadenosine phosphosulfate reductase
MEGHLKATIATIDRQFGEGVGRSLLPSDKPIVMNKVSSLDAMYEVIVDGRILGRLRFDIPKGDYTFVLSVEGGRRIGLSSRQKWVSCYDGVLQYLKGGANLMVPGIAGCDSGICEEDEVWLTDSNGGVVGVGIARMSGKKMATEKKGFAVKVREFSFAAGASLNPKTATWDDVVLANAEDLKSVESEAISFISRTISSEGLDVVVGFSGGKDSLATYLLVERSMGKSPPLFFMNTGLELPETIEYVREFARGRQAELISRDMGEKFWESVKTFGPPARDFRWCCKVLKLGPAATAIADTMQGHTLAFMGQRKLESFQRSVEPRVTLNPWVPGQTSANPIQNWNALEVWLYIFRERAAFNPLYNRGYHRMGCYLCPASPMAELESLKVTHPALYGRLKTMLHDWAVEYGYSPEWADMGFWRWKRIPAGQTNLIQSMGLRIEPQRESLAKKFELSTVKGVSPCVVTGFSLEGQFSSGLNLDRVSHIMPVFGPTKSSEEMGAIRTKAGQNTILLFSSGSVIVRGSREKDVETTTDQLERAVRRAVFCQSCGSCIPKCVHSALYLDHEGKISVDENKCVGCLECDLWPCPTYMG